MSENSIFQPEAKESLEQRYLELARTAGTSTESSTLESLIAVVRSHARYLEQNLVEIGGVEVSDAAEMGWQTAWSFLGRVMSSELFDDPTMEVSARIDRAAGEFFDLNRYESGAPTDVGLREFYRIFGSRLVNGSVRQTAAWITDSR